MINNQLFYGESDLEKGILVTDRFVQGDDILVVLSKEGYKDITAEHPFGEDRGDDLIITQIVRNLSLPTIAALI